MNITTNRLVVVEWAALTVDLGGPDQDALDLWQKLTIGAFDRVALAPVGKVQFVVNWLAHLGIGDVQVVESMDPAGYVRTTIAQGRPVLFVSKDPARVRDSLRFGAGVALIANPMNRPEWREEERYELRPWSELTAEIIAQEWHDKETA